MIDGLLQSSRYNSNLAFGDGRSLYMDMGRSTCKPKCYSGRGVVLQPGLFQSLLLVFMKLEEILGDS